MRTRRILVSSEEVTRFTGSPEMVPLLDITTPDGTSYIFSNPSQLVAKLYDNTGAQIPSSSDLYFFKERPGEDFGTFLGKVSYAPYYDLDEGQQRDTKFAAMTTQPLGPVNVAGVQNDAQHVLRVFVASPVTVDLTKSGTRFEIIALEQN